MFVQLPIINAKIDNKAQWT